MDMYVKSTFDKFDKEIKDVQVIPHIGSRINLGFSPAPIVKEVIFDYERNLVIVDCSN